MLFNTPETFLRPGRVSKPAPSEEREEPFDPHRGCQNPPRRKSGKSLLAAGECHFPFPAGGQEEPFNPHRGCQTPPPPETLFCETGLPVLENIDRTRAPVRGNSPSESARPSATRLRLPSSQRTPGSHGSASRRPALKARVACPVNPAGVAGFAGLESVACPWGVKTRFRADGPGGLPPNPTVKRHSCLRTLFRFF